jgi:hypothetical protein
MSRKLFLVIVYVIQRFDTYFICKKDYTSMVGFSSQQKCTNALRKLAYGALGDAHDDYIRMAESTAMECMYSFYKQWWRCLDQTTREHPIKKTLLGSWHKMKRGDFLGCSVALIACIGNRRTVYLLGRACKKVIKEVVVWY